MVDTTGSTGLGPVHHISKLDVRELRPTQITVGLREVAEKREQWRALKKKDRKEFLDSHLVPAVLGPNGAFYITDHHHLARALLDEGWDTVWAAVQADLGNLGRDEFWVVMDHRMWVHPYDADGIRRDFSDVPKRIAALVDDPYRSLAGEVRRRGGFSKDTTPFSEFLWADFFRRRIPESQLREDFVGAVALALELCHTRAAIHLPGWSGTHIDDRT
ncbi:ParB-like protein [Labrys wisconsinensis]|uniref:Chromosome partitioning protein ParB n=1 Tax=Labrys wisconsinensis TaxID=425677 RepID=A0ABU0J5Z7_9HYPH|nr:ParB-like protein [Labrys wisconsinensis]MDQ0469065.1 hypothetical protein [Labrys wisconsinensis]